MQTVNKSIALFSKDGTFTGRPLGTPQFSATFEQFWTGANTATACDGGNNFITGKPVSSSIIKMDAGLFSTSLMLTWIMDRYYLCLAVSNGLQPPKPAGPADPAYFTPAYWYYFAFDTTMGGGMYDTCRMHPR